MTAWWPRSPELPVKSRTDRDQIAEGIDALSQPCDPAWLMARVLALLTPYFTASVPEAVRVLEAEDWRAALHVFPHWAVEKAVRWWKSDANPDHRRKPLEGDIVGRVKLEMGIVSMGRLMVRRFDEGFAAAAAGGSWAKTALTAGSWSSVTPGSTRRAPSAHRRLAASSPSPSSSSSSSSAPGEARAGMGRASRTCVAARRPPWSSAA